jgi:hypothetical protein
MRQCAVKVNERSYTNYLANITTAAPQMSDTWSNIHPPVEMTKWLRKHYLKERPFLWNSKIFQLERCNKDNVN